MNDPRFVARRHVLRLLAGAAGLLATASRGALAQALDQGIGGTGVVAPPDADKQDRGIGGTGVIGTIRKFGSIVVNDLRISYPADAAVRIDGAPATPADLKLGQVVRVVAEPTGDGYTTRRIEVASEVVGPVDKVAGKTLVVLGQTVSTDGLASTGPWRRGDHVAVSGLRRPDGTIDASLIERRSGADMRVAGPVVAGPDGAPRIGGLRLAGADPALVGERALVVGQRVRGRFDVTAGEAQQASFGASVRRVSIEAYVQHADGGLRLGSGLKIAGGGNDVAGAGVVRAVLTGAVDRHGGLRVESVRVDHGGHGGPGPRGPRGGGPHRGPGGRGGRGGRFGRFGGRGFGPMGRRGGAGPHGFGGPRDFGGPGEGGPGGFGGPGMGGGGGRGGGGRR